MRATTASCPVCRLSGVGRAGENVVAGEDHPPAVDLTVQAQGEFGLTRHPVGGQLKSLPIDRLAILQQPVLTSQCAVR